MLRSSSTAKVSPFSNFLSLETLLLSVSSKPARQFVFVRVTVAPFSVTFISPLRVQNATSVPLTLLLTREDEPNEPSKKTEELTVEPFAVQPLPFHLSLGFFSLQLKPESFNFSNPVQNTDIASDRPSTVTCSPLAALPSISVASSWNTHIRVGVSRLV